MPTGDVSLLTVGLDGATWRVLDPLLDRGALPALATCIDAGARGTAQSVLPHITTPAWQAWARGADPATLGVYGHVGLAWDGDGLDSHLVDRTHYGGTPFWHAMSAAGQRVGVLNLHHTAPVDAINGVIVAEHATPDATHCSPEAVRDAVTPEPEMPDPGSPAYFDTLLATIRERFAMARQVIREHGPFDWLHLSIFYCDAIQHSYWNGDEVAAAWRAIDAELGALLETANICETDPHSDDANPGFQAGNQVCIVSDHGHTRNRDRFYINQWLEREGLLVRRDATDVAGGLASLGLHRDRLERWARAVGVREVARRVVPERWRRFIPDADGRRRGVLALEASVDPAHTLALSPGSDQVWFREGVYPWGAVDKLRELRHPEDGRRVFRSVQRAHKCYASVPDGGPGVVLEPNGYAVAHTLPDGDAVWGSRLPDAREPWRSTHDRDGICVVAGDGVTVDATDCRLIDVVPTLLASRGVPVPASADGTVQPWFGGVADVPRRAYDGGGSSARSVVGEDARERLAQLGYLDGT